MLLIAIGALSLVAFAIFIIPDMFSSFAAFGGCVLFIIGLCWLINFLGALTGWAPSGPRKNKDEDIESEEEKDNEKVKDFLRSKIDCEFEKEYPDYPDFAMIKGLVETTKPSDDKLYGAKWLWERKNLIKMYVSSAYRRGDYEISNEALALYNYLEKVTGEMLPKRTSESQIETSKQLEPTRKDKSLSSSFIENS